MVLWVKQREGYKDCWWHSKCQVKGKGESSSTKALLGTQQAALAQLTVAAALWSGQPLSSLLIVTGFISILAPEQLGCCCQGLLCRWRTSHSVLSSWPSLLSNAKDSRVGVTLGLGSVGP